MEPLPNPTDSSGIVHPAAVDLNNTVSVTIDISHFLQEQAGRSAPLGLGEFELLRLDGEDQGLAPMLGIISRSVASALGILEVTHLRVLVILSQKDSLSAGELIASMKMRPRPMMKLLDSMEDAGWIYTEAPRRGVNEKVAITEQGRALVVEVTNQRQREIDEILGRLSTKDQASLAIAFEAFATAAREPYAPRPKKGIAP